jgi:hypothetical protein
MEVVMFEKASRVKLRFEHKGQCSVEDLWDLSTTVLDAMYKHYSAQLKDQLGDSLLEKKSKIVDLLEMKIEIVKHIVLTKIKEKKEAEERSAKIEKKRQILEIISEKQHEHLKNMSLEDLTKMVEDI